MAEQYKVLIIGAGNKGALGPVSHAAAFSENPNFKIVGFVDTDESKTMQAVKRWGGVAYTIDNDYFNKTDPPNNLMVDVVSIAAPDEEHAKVLQWLVGSPVRFIFAEKPFTNNAHTAAALLKEFETHNQTVMVNYTRRFVPGFRQIQRLIPEWGEFLGGSAFYTKELHNLCHWVDTFLMLGIDPEAVQYIQIERSKLNAFEAFLYFEKGRLDILQFGDRITFTEAEQRIDFPDDRIIGDYDNNLGDSLDLSMPIAVQNIADHLLNGTTLMQDARDAVKVLEICERLLK